MAIEMQQRMKELKNEWEERGIERPFKIRIGISTGYCTVGNFGSEDRMDYTIIGNQVNLAARLETNAKPTKILISHETCSLIRDSIITNEEEPLNVKGFDKPVHCYAVVGLRGEGNKIENTIIEEMPGINLRVDLDEEEPEEVIKTLEKFVERVKTSIKEKD
jgi:adenylate cyclase